MKNFIYSIKEEKHKFGKYITAEIYVIKQNKPIKIGSKEWNTASCRGQESEIVRALVDYKVLPKKALDDAGYIDYAYKDGLYLLFEV